MTLVPATEAHCLELGARMRVADALEVERAGGHTPAGAALKSLRASREVWAVLEQDELLAVWGVVEAAPGAGVAWVLTSDAVDRFPLTFWRTSKALLADLRTRWPILFNSVDADYAAALRWLRRLGFAIAEPAPFGLFGKPFCRVELRSPSNV